jgi:CheY-like chemotaxis protein
MRVLLAEDNLVNQRVAVRLLTKRGHHVTVVGNGRDAVEAAAAAAFDVVLMDVQMPEMSGFEATAAIRQAERETGTHLRIIAMTAHALKGDRERCLAAGMDGYISKPIEPATLFATVEEEESPTGEPLEAPSMPVGPSADREALMNRVGGDEQLFNEIVQLFLVDCPIRLTAIQAAVASGDCEEIRLEAHALKGSASNVSAIALSSAARTLERVGVERRIEAAPAALRNLSAQAVLTIDLLRQWVPALTAPSEGERIAS